MSIVARSLANPRYVYDPETVMAVFVLGHLEGVENIEQEHRVVSDI